MGHASAAGVVDGVDDGRMRAAQRDLARAGGAEGAVRTRGLHVDELDVVRDILDGGDTGTGHGAVLLDVLVVFGEGQTDALGDTAVELAVGEQAVDHLADVGHHGHLFHLGLAGGHFHGHFGHKQAVHVAAEGFALAVLAAVAGRGGSVPSSFRR